MMKHKLTNQSEDMSFFKTALMLNGSVTPKVIKKVFMLIIYATLVSYLSHIYPFLALPIGPFEYGGLIMGLILVFRINAGYDRWWEARKLWGSIVNQSRNLTIILVNYTTHTDSDWLLKITNYISALPYLIKDHLRETKDIESVKHLIDDSTYQTLLKSENTPNILSSMIANELHYARDHYGLDPFSFIRAEEQRGKITDAQGACERILKTPMPFVMAIKSRRFILFFLLVLPFALINVSLFITPWISGIVAYAMLSLDQIGFELQNPFSHKNLSHLPLNDICQSIEQNITELRKT
jgi:ion channel-forming bestrophin family protein